MRPNKSSSFLVSITLTIICWKWKWNKRTTSRGDFKFYADRLVSGSPIVCVCECVCQVNSNMRSFIVAIYIHTDSLACRRGSQRIALYDKPSDHSDRVRLWRSEVQKGRVRRIDHEKWRINGKGSQRMLPKHSNWQDFDSVDWWRRATQSCGRICKILRGHNS